MTYGVSIPKNDIFKNISLKYIDVHSKILIDSVANVLIMDMTYDIHNYRIDYLVKPQNATI